MAVLSLVGMAAWALPTALASDPPAEQPVLGVDAEKVVALGAEMAAEEKFEGTLESDAPALVTKAALMTASTKAVARVPKPAAKKPAAPKPAPKATAKAPAKAAAPKAKSAASGNWSSAKVSWYGPGFYGNTMAGGGKLAENSMVVAHRTMAFGTKIEFKYNGRTCVAVVQDRGPHVAGRVFDLGPGTAKSLGFSSVGTVQYRIIK